MSEPQRIESQAAEGDKDARIEQLLLSGLDHYFAGQYEQAINVWTRVVFLERGHDRARAYIERARGAVAEQHRESEELLHRGVAAFDRGETDEARELITRAVEQGGPHDLALVFLERLNRLGGPSPAARVARRSIPVEQRTKPSAADAVETYSWPVRVFALTALLSAVFAGLLLGGVPILDWLSLPAGEPAREQVVTVKPEPLPIARSSELVVARAQSLQQGGHLHDALRMLESVDRADPLRVEADRLKAQVQRQLLAAARAPMAGARGAR